MTFLPILHHKYGENVGKAGEASYGAIGARVGKSEDLGEKLKAFVSDR